MANRPGVRIGMTDAYAKQVQDQTWALGAPAVVG